MLLIVHVSCGNNLPIAFSVDYKAFHLFMDMYMYLALDIVHLSVKWSVKSVLVLLCSLLFQQLFHSNNDTTVFFYNVTPPKSWWFNSLLLMYSNTGVGGVFLPISKAIAILSSEQLQGCSLLSLLFLSREPYLHLQVSATTLSNERPVNTEPNPANKHWRASIYPITAHFSDTPLF